MGQASVEKDIMRALDDLEVCRRNIHADNTARALLELTHAERHLKKVLDQLNAPKPTTDP